MAKQPVSLEMIQAVVDAGLTKPGMPDLIRQIQQLYTDRAMHVRRGYCICDTDLPVITNHLIEEAVELQAELTLNGTHESQVDEAADVLTLLTHALIRARLDFDEVVAHAQEKIRLHWTTDETKVGTKTPGFTRRTRARRPARQPQVNPDDGTISFSDNSYLEPPSQEEPAIRRRDEQGNFLDVRNPGDGGYDEWAGLFGFEYKEPADGTQESNDAQG